jgi:cation transport regulator ChaC
MSKDYWYLAYGSNLWKKQKVVRTGSIRTGNESPQIARLADYRLAFNKRDKNGEVVANIMAAPGNEVIGIVYRVNDESLKKMDKYERGYDRSIVSVILENKTCIEAFIYIAIAKNVIAEEKPTTEYLNKIINGANEHGLPIEYIEKIQKLALSKKFD